MTSSLVIPEARTAPTLVIPEARLKPTPQVIPEARAAGYPGSTPLRHPGRRAAPIRDPGME